MTVLLTLVSCLSGPKLSHFQVDPFNWTHHLDMVCNTHVSKTCFHLQYFFEGTANRISDTPEI